MRTCMPGSKKAFHNDGKVKGEAKDQWCAATSLDPTPRNPPPVTIALTMSVHVKTKTNANEKC